MSELNEEYFEIATSCYCSTTNPPCGYCEGMGDCDECGIHLKCEYFKEMKDGRYLCDECYEKEHDAEG